MDEGYEHTHDVYRHAGSHVESEAHICARDCDGPMEHHWYGVCDLDKLQDCPPHEQYPNGPHVPQWHTVDMCQRDHFVEAMGY